MWQEVPAEPISANEVNSAATERILILCYEGDIAALLEAARPNLPGVFAVLSEYMLATDLQAVREIVNEIQQRLSRFERGLDNPA